MKHDIYTYKIEASLYINITNACPCCCTFCIRDTQKGIGYDLWLSGGDPTAEQIISEIREAKSWAKEAVFCGYGEPTMRLATVLEVAAFCKTIALPTRLNTNGLGNLINKRDITAELFSHIDSFSVSLNAPNNDRYQELCRPYVGDFAYPAVLEFIKKLASLGADVTASVVDALSEDEILECKKIAAELGAKFRVRAL